MSNQVFEFCGLVHRRSIDAPKDERKALRLSMDIALEVAGKGKGIRKNAAACSCMSSRSPERDRDYVFSAGYQQEMLPRATVWTCKRIHTIE
jgi:hypothetical protein